MDNQNAHYAEFRNDFKLDFGGSFNRFSLPLLSACRV